MSIATILQTCSLGDRRLFLWLAPPDTTRWGRVWNRAMSRLADGPLYVVLAFLPMVLGSPEGGRFLTAMALGFALELPAYTLVKKICRRPRPCDGGLDRANLLPIPDRYSFPSGHTAGAFVLAGCVGQFFASLAPAAYGFALAVGYSRVYNRLHFPADILAGAGLGACCAAVSIVVAGLG